MAFNLATFKTRTLTAAVFVVVMAAGLLLNQWSFFILFSIVHFGCWKEYQKLVGLIDKEYVSITDFHKYGVMIAGWCVMLYFTDDNFMLFGIRLHALGWWLGLVFVFVLPLIELLFASNIRLKNIWAFRFRAGIHFTQPGVPDRPLRSRARHISSVVHTGVHHCMHVDQ